MRDHWILDDNGEPVACDLMTWARWFESNKDARRIAFDTFGKVAVSTVFLGLDHSFGAGPPVLWETMTFGLPGDDQPQERYTSKADALAGHARAVEEVKAIVANGSAPCPPT